MKKRLMSWGRGIVVLIACYLGSAAILFDFSEMAWPHDEEDYQGRRVSFGPRPRPCFCVGSYAGGFHFDGSEWALVVYRPVCQTWVICKGFAVPHRWRAE
jgi:hypothetical protein